MFFQSQSSVISLWEHNKNWKEIEENDAEREWCERKVGNKQPIKHTLKGQVKMKEMTNQMKQKRENENKWQKKKNQWK